MTNLISNWIKKSGYFHIKDVTYQQVYISLEILKSALLYVNK